MQKTLISSLILTALLLGGCEDKNRQAQLEQQTQTISRLSAENAQLKNELAAEKANAEKQIPAILGQVETIFAEDATVKFQQKDEYAGEQANVSYSFTTYKTGVDWIDKVLLQQIDTDEITEKDASDYSVAQLQQLLAESFQQDKNDLSTSPMIGIDRTSWAEFVGQREKLALFRVVNSNFEGGAHGFGWTTYVNLDLAQRKLLTLADIFDEPQLAQVKALLWAAYKEDKGDGSTFTQEADFYVSKNFYLTENGITFSYAPYAIGPYAEGQKELSLPWWSLDKLLKPAFKQQKYY